MTETGAEQLPRPIEGSPRGLWDLLESYFHKAPNDLLYTFLNAEGDEKGVTVGQFRQDAISTAHYLNDRGAKSGEIILISIDQGYRSAALFWGALYLGAVPSLLAYSPPREGSHSYYRSIERLADFTGAPAVVVERQNLEGFSNASDFALIPKPPAVLPEITPEPIPPPTPRPADTAYVQFSSGTTGSPKGVVLSHGSIIQYLQVMHEAWRITRDDVFVGWLPLFHDMGLTIQLLQPVYSQTHSVLFSPTDWLLRPQILFEAVDQYKGSITWMPNFAFNYCLRHIRDEHMLGLDLSSWRILGCASEPVQIETLQAFSDRYKEYGLAPSSLMVAYGLAENIAAVSLTSLDRPPDVDWVSDEALQSLYAKPVRPGSNGSRTLAACGFPIPLTQIKVTDNEGKRLADRQVGNVLIKSPYIFDRYFRLPEETDESFNDGWLQTGDLGYMLDGQLFICGRKKELIIVRGRNLLPHHLEEIAAVVLGKNLRYSVAVGVADRSTGTEVPVLVCEMRGDHSLQQQAEWARTIRDEVNQDLQIHLEDIRFVQKGWIEKTTSGKINHIANREKYLREINKQETIEANIRNKVSRNITPTEDILFRMWSGLLKTTAIDFDDDFFQLGGDSLAAAELIFEIEAQFGIHVPSNLFFEQITFAEMVKYIDEGAQSLPETIAVAIQPLQESSKRLPFFCIHAINGNVLGYWRLSKLLGEHQPFYGIQAHGLNGVGEPDKRVEAMAERYIQAIREVQPSGPYSLGGYCFGGLVAFEMAKQLIDAGQDVKDVIVIDFEAPKKDSRLSSVSDELVRLSRLLRHFPRELSKYRQLDPEQKKNRRERIMRRLKKRLKKLMGAPVHLSVEDTFNPQDFSATRQRIDAAIVEAFYQYHPGPYPGSLKLIRTKRGLLDLDKSMGWRKFARDGVEIIYMRGSHDTVLQQPNVDELADRLRDILK